MKSRTVGMWALIGICVLALLPAQAKEPDVIVVQHILIGFKKTVSGKTLDRTKKEAQALAMELLERARKGEDFDALVKEYTDDRYPGIYKLSNTGTALLPDAFKRTAMVPGFGDTAFRLEVGEVAIAKYNSMTSPYGFHIIKRFE